MEILKGYGILGNIKGKGILAAWKEQRPERRTFQPPRSGLRAADGIRMEGKEFFIEKSRKKPEGREVQADDAVNIPFGVTVIPGTAALFFEPFSADKFSEKDSGCIEAATEKNVFLTKKAGERTDKGGAAIDGKHPEGGTACQCFFMSAKGTKSGPEDFQAPADDAALNKFVLHIQKYGQESVFYSIQCSDT